MKKAIKKLARSTINSIGYNVIKINKPLNKRQTSGYKVVSALEHNTSENMDVYFSDPQNVENYVKGRQVFYNILADKILNQDFNYSNNLKVCDVGCGPGDLLNFLSLKLKDQNNHSEFYGLDHSEKLIEIGTKRFPQIQFKQFNVYEEHTSFKNAFDIVICSEVIEHLVEARKAVINLLTMVKKAGLLILTVPEGRKDNYLGQINFWSPESWKQFINEICEDHQNTTFVTHLLKTPDAQFNFAAISIN